MNKCICSGSFDPITLGHVDIIRRSARLFDEVLVAVAVNRDKKMAFSREERMEMAREATQDIQNVKIIGFDGLLAELATREQATVIARGLRDSVDYEYEKQMAVINSKLVPQLETIFLPTRAEYMHISSGAVRQLAMLGADVSDMVPTCVLSHLAKLRNSL